MSEEVRSGSTADKRLTEFLLAAGALGGLLWAAVPLGAAVTLYGVGAGFASLSPLGTVFVVAPLAVLGLLAGAVGLNRAFRASLGRLGRAGANALVLGFLLLLPGSVVPSGTWPPSLGRLVPPVFFVGLAVVAVGSLVVGVGARRAGALPDRRAIGFAAAMPVGLVVGGAGAVAGGGNLLLVLGLTVPYGLVWAALGTSLVLAEG